MNKEEIKKIYNILKNEIEEHKDQIKEKIQMDDVITSILSKILEEERKLTKKKVHILEYIDLTNISFENKDVRKIDFSKTNAKIDPQTVKNKDLTETKLSGQDFTGKSFDDVIITRTDFTGATNVNIDPQKIKHSTMVDAKLNGIDFKDKSFDNICIWGVDFTGATNVNIDPQKIKHRIMYECVLAGIDFKDKSFDKVDIRKADFTGATNVEINPQKISGKDLTGVMLGDAKIIGSLEDVIIKGTIFEEKAEPKEDFLKIYTKEIESIFKKYN